MLKDFLALRELLYASIVLRVGLAVIAAYHFVGADLEQVVLEHLYLMVEFASNNSISSHVLDAWSNCSFYIDQGAQLLVIILNAVERLYEICGVVSEEANFSSLEVIHHQTKNPFNRNFIEIIN